MVTKRVWLPVVAAAAVLFVAGAAPAPPAARALLERASRAIGGGEPLHVHELDQTFATTFSSPNGKRVEVEEGYLYSPPNRVRQTLWRPSGAHTAVIIGPSGQIYLPNGQVQAVPSEEAQAVVAKMLRDPVILLGSMEDSAFQVSEGKPSEAEGRACQEVHVRYLDVATALCIDAEGRILRSSYEGRHPVTGLPGPMEVRYSDWRKVGDLASVPAVRTYYYAGGEVMRAELKHADVDPADAADAFGPQKQ